MLLLLAFISSIQVVVPQTAPSPTNPIRLGCERIQGNFVPMRTFFKRAMQPGDKVIINGALTAQAQIVRFNIISPGTIPLHVKANLSLSNMIYDTMIDNKWTRQEFGPQPLRRGQGYQLTIEYTGNAFRILVGQRLIKTYEKRNTSPLQAIDVYGGHRTNWMEMVCRNPPPRPAPAPGPNPSPPLPPRPNPGHGGGHGHGHGHGRWNSKY